MDYQSGNKGKSVVFWIKLIESVNVAVHWEILLTMVEKVIKSFI